MHFPHFAKLLCRYVCGMTQHAEHKFPFTCLVLNFGFPRLLHRDKGNAGPSVIKEMGSYSGSDLEYFPEDDGRVSLDALKREKSVQLNVGRHAFLFNGNKGHCVTKIKSGECITTHS